MPAFHGELTIVSAFSPRDWHIHEMLYGYLPAVIAGFLLTAVPNWTGRLPVRGAPLLLLVLTWAAGRVAVTMSASIGWAAAAAVDITFLAAVTAVTAREIVAGHSRRNLKLLAVVCLLLAGNVGFHLEARLNGAADTTIRVGMATVLLIMLIGGRIVPSFTHNWLARENPGRLPSPFDRLDAVSMVVAGAALAAWCVAPDRVDTGVGLLLAGLIQTVRLARWAGDRTWRDRLVLVLHVAYAFVPLGFILTGAAAIGLAPASAGVHAWTAGAIGGMTLAVMSRASLGHTGRALVATRSIESGDAATAM